MHSFDTSHFLEGLKEFQKAFNEGSNQPILNQEVSNENIIFR